MILKILNSDHQILKRKWFTLLVILEFMLVLYAAMLNSLVVSLFEEIVADTSFVSAVINTVSSIAIFYYCAYKKPGTLLLTLTLIFSPLELLRLFVLYRTMAKVTQGWILGIFLVTYTILTVWWYLLTFQLRRQNQQIQLEAVLASSEYLTALSHLQTTTNLEELDSQFYEAIKERPHLFVKNLQKEYELQKRRFID